MKGNEKRNKKSQASQVFTAILGMVIISGILLFGYSSIKKMIDDTRIAEYIQFCQTLESKTKVVYSDHGTIKNSELILPNGFSVVCFVDNKNYGSIDNDDSDKIVAFDSMLSENQKELIKGSIEDDVTDNVFLFGPRGNFETLYLGSEDKPFILNTDNPLYCVKAVRTVATLRMEGLGNGVKITEW